MLHGPQPLMKVHAGVQPPLAEIALPYALYTDEDIAHRTLYVEASRGCPFKCEFCLSSLDKTAWPFDLDAFLAELEALHARGARLFKFVDRTFNLNIKTSLEILQFFLDKLEAASGRPGLCPLRTGARPPARCAEGRHRASSRPARCSSRSASRPSIPEVQALVSRRQDNDKAADNIRWLCEHSHAHLHVDLIAGLPGEDVDSFARGFDRLVALEPHEIQFGILKRLRGTPIIRHTAGISAWSSTRTRPTPSWPTEPHRLRDHAAPGALRPLLGPGRQLGPLRPHAGMLLGARRSTTSWRFSDWMYENTDATHRIALDRLAGLVTKWLVLQGWAEPEVRRAMGGDYAGKVQAAPAGEGKKAAPQRQARHMESCRPF